MVISFISFIVGLGIQQYLPIKFHMFDNVNF